MSNNTILVFLSAAHTALKRHEDEINRLNVYPVPDGDTGTNMVQTVESVLAEASKAKDGSIEELMAAVTYGSLMGARGNSGVILSQIIKGMCEEIGKSGKLSSETMVKALNNAADAAYRAVKKPVEGTMLTVIRDMAKAAESLCGNKIQPIDRLVYIIEEGKKSVERTPFLLPVLKEAGVVDAGGYGLVVIAQGLLSVFKGERVDTEVKADGFGPANVVEEDLKFTYCTEFILKSDGIDMEALEQELDPLGDSMLIVGTPEFTKIHIHTNEPGRVLQIATDLGTINHVQINNMVEQSEVRRQSIEAERSTEQGIGIVAVASGDGIKNILLNLGVSKVVNGGQSMNPSTADILEAVNQVPANKVIILPNNKNIILAAQQVSSLTDQEVSVIPTKSIPEAFSALLAFDKNKSFEDNFNSMTESFANVKTGELTYAVRDGNNGEFKKDDYIGLFAGDIIATGQDLISTTLDLIKSMVGEDDEVMTILSGEQVAEELVARLIAELNAMYPDIELDVHRGEQPVYHFIIGLE